MISADHEHLPLVDGRPRGLLHDQDVGCRLLLLRRVRGEAPEDRFAQAERSLLRFEVCLEPEDGILNAGRGLRLIQYDALPVGRALREDRIERVITAEHAKEGLVQFALLLVIGASGANDVVDVGSEGRVDAEAVLQGNLERHTIMPRVHEEAADRL